jgi:separase
MSALVGRLIALGLHEQAVNELRVLTRRLQGTTESGPKKSTKTASCESKNAAHSFSELLDFSTVKASGHLLLLIVTTQIQSLRILASTKKPTAIEAALPYLQPDHGSSPIKLLLAAAGEKEADAEKIARQMETVAQCLLSLTPSVSSKDDSLGQESRLSVSPQTALLLQTFALEARLHWWRLAKHKGDTEKDVMVPMSRCLGAYIRRTSENPRASYAACLNMFTRVSQQLQSHELGLSKGSKFPLAGIYQMLVTLSRDAHLLSDAVSWAAKLREAVDTKAESIAKTCSLTAQLLSLHLMQPTKYLLSDQLLRELVEGIQGPLRGDSVELDELLTNVCAVRKSAMNILLSLAKPNSTEKVFEPSPAVRDLLETFILQCPRFCLRWLGKPPGPKGITKDYLRYEQRRRLMLQYLQHILDSAFVTIKTCLDQGRLSWDLMDSILSDCTTLLDYAGSPATPDPATSPFVKISHFYYLQYSSLRQQSTDPKDTAPLRALRRSVECVKNRPGAEKEKAQLTLKLERMADVCKTLGRGEEALGALQAIRASLLEDGVLKSIANSLDTESPATAWNGSEKAEALSRALLSISKMEHAWVDWTVDLPEPERAAALEHRVRFILLREGMKEPRAVLEHPAVDQLLRIYVPTRYPVRRLRVLLILFCSALGRLDKAPELISVTKDAAQLEGQGNLGEDSGLATFLPHMRTLYSSLAAAVDAYRDSDALQKSIYAWRDMIEACRDRAMLEKAVDDLPGLLNYLQSVADFLRMKGRDGLLADTLGLMADIVRAADGSKAEDIVQFSSYLALQYTNLGQSSRAEQVFLKTQEYIGAQLRAETLAHFHLTFTEHYLAISNFRLAEDHLSLAQHAFKADTPIQRHSRAERKRLVANACYLYSVLALERGDSHHALVYARESVRNLFQDWVKLESRLARGTATNQSRIEDHNIDISATELTGNTEWQGLGPEYWRLFYALYRNVFWLSSVYAHIGMFQETMYYAEQALKMAQTVSSDFYNAQCSAWIGSLLWRGAKAERSLEMLQKAAALLQNDDHSYSYAALACQLSSMYHSQNDMEGAELLLAKAEAIAQQLAAIPSSLLAAERVSEVSVVEGKIARLQITDKAPKAARKTTRQTSVKKQTKVLATTKAQGTVTPTPGRLIEDAQLAKLKSSILVQKAVSMLSRRDWAGARSALGEATAASKASSLLSMRQVAMASCLLGMSMEQMAQDPVFSVIQDSTISFPALSGTDKIALARSPAKAASPRKVRSAAVAGQRDQTYETAPRLYVENLREAHDYLLEAHSVAASSGDASYIHKISGMLQNVGLFLTAVSTKTKTATHSAQTSYSVELARNLIWYRERKAILQEKNAIKSDGTEWPPVFSSAASRRSSLGFTLDLHKVQRDYIDIVPKEWNVISISLSEGNHDLCITKLQAGQTPFVLRLPLERASSRDADSDVFDFEQGRSELLDIVKQINKTCHDSRDMSVKGAKSAWWAEREALDERLRALLENVEQIWLGGFRGIFSQHVRQQDLLGKFHKDFLAILDKHLPSRRQVRGKKSKTAPSLRATLDTNILDLFIGLGDATKPDCDLDDELNDLLYFVVDILQFHGERNAYDEIDFDSMVVETFDALQAYHSAAKTTDNSSCSRFHTVLLLDKALHAFPWESLPCMQGLAISRMPSLACLRRLILDQQQQRQTLVNNSKTREEDEASSGVSQEGHHISLSRGTYILNPSGDLTSTQSTFSQPLETHVPPPCSSSCGRDEQAQWKRITGRAPSEDEFSNALTGSDILLYFGHGSGAQYIRSRTIRHLSPRCKATVLLMGCSSAALLESGEFEPSGPVWNYMLAGCPAVVGTLWDVTDRDIDRFAGGCLERWGVLPRGTVTRTEKGEEGSEKMSLVQAVREAKADCKFRFVTAAAVVVYGVPVYIDRR